MAQIAISDKTLDANSCIMSNINNFCVVIFAVRRHWWIVKRWNLSKNNSVHQGRIQDFHLGGGGGAKDYMRERTLRAQNPKSLLAGIQGPLKGPGSSRVF